MQPFIDALYSYAQETRVPRYLHTPEYHQATLGLDDGWNAFRSALTAEQERALDALLAREWEVEQLEDEASFAAALSIGLDLGRL